MSCTFTCCSFILEAKLEPYHTPHCESFLIPPCSHLSAVSGMSLNADNLVLALLLSVLGTKVSSLRVTRGTFMRVRLHSIEQVCSVWRAVKVYFSVILSVRYNADSFGLVPIYFVLLC